MKTTFIKITFIILVTFSFQGCYTILWSPDIKITDDYETTSYYSGYASDFYDIPWWINVPVIVGYPYPVTGNDSVTKDRSNSSGSDSRNIRNNDGGRNSGDKNQDIINTPPPTVSSPGSTTTSSGSDRNTNSGSTVRTESSSTNSSGSQNTRSSDTRNNSGSRNSGSGRR